MLLVFCALSSLDKGYLPMRHHAATAEPERPARVEPEVMMQLRNTSHLGGDQHTCGTDEQYVAVTPKRHYFTSVPEGRELW
ncbi:hypothetical protein OK016_26275 [Vibrio chagasii]|nr:hypothetical protein [Vibrio chagasii]